MNENHQLLLDQGSCEFFDKLQLPHEKTYEFYREILNENEDLAFLHDNSQDFSPEDHYKQCVSSQKNTSFSLELQQVYNYSSILYDNSRYHDPYPLLKLRKKVRLACQITRFLCYKLENHKVFRFLVFLVIFLQAILLSSGNSSIYAKYGFFLFFFFEMLVKLLAFGVFSEGNGYIFSGYNVLDLLINGSFILTRISGNSESESLDFSAFRTIRLIKSVPNKRLQHIIQSIISSFWLLSEIIVLLISFLMVYTLIGLHLFHGLLKNRCLQQFTGLPSQPLTFCGNLSCKNSEICGQVAFNPDSDLTSFDNLFHSMLQVFRIFTLSDWTNIMYVIQKTYSNFSWIYAVSLIFFGNFFLLNLILAILKVKFGENQRKFTQKLKEKLQPALLTLDYKQMVEERVYLPKKGQRSHNTSAFITLNSKILPKSSKKSNGPLYLNTSLQSMKSIKSGFFQPFWKAFDQIKDQFHRFSKQMKGSKTSILGVSSVYLEVVVKNQENYTSNSQNDVVNLEFRQEKAAKTEEGRRLRRQNTIDYRGELEKLKLFFENLQYNANESEKNPEGLEKMQRFKTVNFNFRKTLPFIGANSTRVNKSQNNNANMQRKSILKSDKNHQVFKGRKVRQERGVVLASKIQLNAIIINKIKEPLLKEDFYLNSDNVIENDAEYSAILEKDRKKGKKEDFIWSGNEVLTKSSYSQGKLVKLFRSLASTKEYQFEINYNGIFGNFRGFCKLVCQTKGFFLFNFLTICLITISMALQGNISNDDAGIIYEFCSFYNAFEIILKLVAYGFKRVMKDRFLNIDIITLIYFINRKILILIDYDISDLRFLQSIVLLRNIRLFSLIKYMETILYVIRHTYYSIINLALILTIFLLTFALFGLQVFQHKLTSVGGTRFIYFDTLPQSLISVFDLVTFDNWYLLLIDGVQKGFTFSMIFFIFASIFIGSYLLLNLFMAIVLEGFEYATTLYESNKAKIHENTNNNNNNSNKNRIALSPRNTAYRKTNSSPTNKRNLQNLPRFSSFASQILRLGKRKHAFIVDEGDKTLGIFSKFGTVRRFCTKIISFKGFQFFITSLYILHACLMAFETYSPQTFYYHGVVKPSNSIELETEFNVKLHFFFMISISLGWFFEIILKVIKDGLIMSQNAYLKNLYNCIELLTIFLHLIDWLVKFPWVYNILGYARILRTLNLLNLSNSLRTQLKTLLNSIYKLLNVLLVVFLAWLIFAIIGIILYRDRLNYCQNTEEIILYDINQKECLQNGFSWQISDLNFQNIQFAFLSLVSISSYDNWLSFLQICVNSNTSDIGATLFKSESASYIYFILLIVIAGWFFIGLVNGVTFSIFFREHKQHSHKYLDDNQVKWLEISKIILKTKPLDYSIPDKGFVFSLYSLKKSRLYSQIKFLVLLSNFIILCLLTDKTSYDYYVRYLPAYVMLTFFYGAELFSNFLIFGPKTYLSPKNLWHWVLVFIFLVYLANTTMTFFSEHTTMRNQQLGLRFFRFLLILSTVRLIKRFKALKKLFSVLSFSLPMILNIFYLLFLIFFVYAMIACRWYSSLSQGEVLDEYVTFKDFFYALMTMFSISTANNWTAILFNVVNSPEESSTFKPRNYLFFISFMLLTFFFLMNLFSLTLTKQFEDFYTNRKSPMQLYNDNLKSFRGVWSNFCIRGNLFAMKTQNLIRFFRRLGAPLGCASEQSDREIEKKIMNLQISKENELVHFNELLYTTMRHFFRDILKKNSNEQSLLEMKANDQNIMKKIELKKNCLRKNEENKGNSERIRRGLRMKENEMEKILSVKSMRKTFVNPLFHFFINYLIFKTWKRYSVEKLQNFEHFSCSSQEET